MNCTTGLPSLYVVTSHLTSVNIPPASKLSIAFPFLTLNTPDSLNIFYKISDTQ